MGTIELTVEDAYPDDLGRGIARVSPGALSDLGANVGDVVAFRGIPAKVWRLNRDDWDSGMIRLDSFTRQDAGVGIGDPVTLRRVDPIPADKLLVTVSVEADPIDEAVAAVIKRYVLGRPVVEGMSLAVRLIQDHPYTRGAEELLEGSIEMAEPTPSILRVTDETTVRVVSR